MFIAECVYHMLDKGLLSWPAWSTLFHSQLSFRRQCRAVHEWRRLYRKGTYQLLSLFLHDRSRRGRWVIRSNLYRLLGWQAVAQLTCLMIRVPQKRSGAILLPYPYNYSGTTCMQYLFIVQTSGKVNVHCVSAVRHPQVKG